MTQNDDDAADVTRRCRLALWCTIRDPLDPTARSSLRLERIAETLQGMQDELARIRRLLEPRLGKFAG